MAQCPDSQAGRARSFRDVTASEGHTIFEFGLPRLFGSFGLSCSFEAHRGTCESGEKGETRIKNTGRAGQAQNSLGSSRKSRTSRHSRASKTVPPISTFSLFPL